MANKKHEYFNGTLLEIWRLPNDTYGNPRQVLKIECEDGHILNMYSKSYYVGNCPLGSKCQYEICGRGYRQGSRYFTGGKLVYFVDRLGHTWDYRCN